MTRVKKRKNDEAQAAFDASEVTERLIEASAMSTTVDSAPAAQLPGCTVPMSETIRDIVRRQYDGEGPYSISTAMGKSASYVSVMEVKHPEGFAVARAEHAVRVLAKFGVDLQMISAKIFGAGFLAVETLTDLMTDKEIAPSIRQKSATSILTLINSSQRVAEDATEKADQGTVKALQNMLEEKLSNATIIDVGEGGGEE